MTSSMWAAGQYQAVAERISGIAAELVRAAGQRVPLAGAAVVDLGCGTGSVSLLAAAAGARVTGVDITAELLALAARRAAADGREITWLTADAADTGLPTRSFDVAVSNMGIIFVDPQRQVDELARLLKPGGVLAFSAWMRTVDNPLSDPIVEVFGRPAGAAFSPDQWGDPAIVTARLQTRFTDIAVETKTHTWQFESIPEALHFLSEESPIHVAVFQRADGPQRERLQAAFTGALQPHCDAAGAISFDVPYVVVSARAA